jgi:asparagine synthase (glutamine-hydrolysing)
MCGICGILNFDSSVVERNSVKEMCDIIEHRGPDAEGIYVKNNIGLGHKRLSIIDLSEFANQPMVSGNRRYVVVFNGEIYNYRDLSRELVEKGIRLKTTSDTEVLLELFSLYNIESIKKLRGMFSFVIWDSFERKIYLIRDRVGIKPLYYSILKNKIIFASEIKAILCNSSVPRNINIDSFWKYCRHFTVPAPETIINDIHKLNPGTVLICDERGNHNFVKYWDIKDYYNTKIYSDENDAIVDIENVIDESVNYHTVSDVPVGAFLSGGLDSSLITNYLKKYVEKLDTYSMSFIENLAFDESKYANYISELYNTNHKSIDFSRNIFNENFEKIIWHCDEPFAIASSFGIFILSKFASKNIKVVMTGDGADELFGGYNGFTSNNIYDYNYFSKLFINTLEKMFLKFGEYNNSRFIRNIYSKVYKRAGSKGNILTDFQSYSAGNSFINVVKRDYFREMINSWNTRLYNFYYNNGENFDEVTRRMYAEVKTRLVDEMLTKTDRMTMAHSLEARVPFLDVNVIEKSASLPVNLKINFNKKQIVHKYILKKISEKYFNKNFIYRKKSGFDVPYSDWLKDNATYMKFKDAIMNGELIKNNIIDSDSTLRIIDDKLDYSFIWSIGIFEKWQKMYSDKFGSFIFN